MQKEIKRIQYLWAWSICNEEYGEELLKEKRCKAM